MRTMTQQWMRTAFFFGTLVLVGSAEAGCMVTGSWTQAQAMGEQAAGDDPYVVGRAIPPLDPGRAMVEMSLDEAIARALELNLDLQAARLEPRVLALSLAAAQGAFAPTLSGTYGFDNSTRQSTSQLDGGIQTSTERLTFNTSLSQDLPWYGGRLSAHFNNSRTETNNAFSTLNPSYSSSFSLAYTQPLLSGLKTDNQRAAVEAQEIRTQIADIQLDARTLIITDLVRMRYWGLRAAIEQIEIQRRALERSQDLLARNEIRVELGTMSRLEVVQALSQVATAEQALLNAEVEWRAAELGLKSLLIEGPDDLLFDVTINPTQLPTVQEQAVDIQAAIRTALRERADLQQSRHELEISALGLEVTQDARLPQLDLAASYSLAGVGGDEFDRPTLGGDPVLVDEGGYSNALGSITDFETPSWSVSLNFSYPIGMKVGNAEAERAKVEHTQSELSIRTAELVVVTEVTDAGLAVTDTGLQLTAASRSRELAEASASATLTRFEAGTTTNFEVGQANDDLTAARLNELRALINHINAIATFERVQRVG